MSPGIISEVIHDTGEQGPKGTKTLRAGVVNNSAASYHCGASNATLRTPSMSPFPTRNRVRSRAAAKACRQTSERTTPHEGSHARLTQRQGKAGAHLNNQPETSTMNTTPGSENRGQATNFDRIFRMGGGQNGQELGGGVSGVFGNSVDELTSAV